MKAGRIPILFIILIFLGGIGFKALHPLYHSHKYKAPEDVSTIHITSSENCYIDYFQFYQKDRVESEEVQFNKPPIFSKISRFFNFPSLNGSFIHYLLRGPPVI